MSGTRGEMAQEPGVGTTNLQDMKRSTAILLTALLLVIGLVSANPLAAFVDVGTHQRVHEGKVADLQLESPGVPTQRISAAPCIDGMSADTFPCEGIDLLGYVPLGEMRASSGIGVNALGGGASDIWGWVDPLDGGEYVMMGKTNGTAFFNITDPTAPVYLGDLPSRALAQLVWFDIKVYEDHAFIVSESAPFGMQVFDLTRLRDVDNPQVFDEDFFYPLSISAHNIAINEDSGFAYIVGGNIGLAAPDVCASGLHIIDIRTPTLPVFAGCHMMGEGPGTALGLVDDGTLSPAAYIHDTHCVIYDGPDERYTGRELCVNSSEVHVSIVDVTDKLRPRQISIVTYDDTAYTHQGWLSGDHAFFFLGDELDERNDRIPTRTIIFDVSDLESPVLHMEYFSTEDAIDHNMYELDGFMYQSNYTAGLRVLDVRGVAERDVSEVAFFDLFPSSNAATFNGTWSNFPYFPSGTIAVSSINDGLFLLRVQEPVFEGDEEG